MVKHLRDLLTIGKEVEIEFIDPETGDVDTLTVWVAKPNSTQQGEASHQARVAQIRRRSLLMSEDAFGGLLADEVPYEEDELFEILLTVKREDIRRQAYEEVLHSEEIGSNWQDEKFDLLVVAEATEVRLRELMEQGDDPETDEEFVRLNEQQSRFFAEVDERINKLESDERKRLTAYTVDELRKMVIDEYVDRECQIVWYETYRNHLLLSCIRYVDNRKKQYFDSVDQLADLPDVVFQQLWNGFNSISVQGDDLKK